MTRKEAERIVNNLYNLCMDAGKARMMACHGDFSAEQKAQDARQAMVDLLVAMERK